ncbi:MAG: Lrp/AsnC family transcriptional regulator, partial [Acidobacteria bacterium]|nr:Lrp/AsnC family transcriptional regulator [Acidobacteriota bacterium]
LQNNGRLSNKELAARVGVAPSTCLLRVRRLQEGGALRGFYTSFDSQSLGVGLHAIVSVQLRRHLREWVESFRAHALSLPEVVDLYHMSGVNDFLIHVAVRDSQHLRELAMTAFTTRREVSKIETALVFEHVSSHRLPVYVQPAE